MIAEETLLSDEEFDALTPDDQQLYLDLLAAETEVWTLTPKQLEAEAMCDDVDEFLYGGSAGGGKMQKISATVYTPFGETTIGQLAVADDISNPDGSVAKVVAVWEHGIQPLWRLTFSDGAETTAGADHLWQYRRSGVAIKRDIDWKVCTTQQLEVQLLKAKAQQATGKRPNWPLIPLTEPVEFTRPSANRWGPARPIDPYVLGALIGDGSLGKAITLTSMDMEVAEAFVSEVERWGGTWSSHQKKDNQAFQFAASRCPDFSAAIDKLGLLGHTAADKFIPDGYQYAPISDRVALMQGLMDTDGTADGRGHASFCSISKQLATDVQWVARSLGFKATITEKDPFYRDADGDKIMCSTAYNVQLSGRNAAHLFRLSRKSGRCGEPQQPGIRRLVSIEPAGEAICRCITVDNPNGLYLTDDFIVTHNSEWLLYHADRLSREVPGHASLILRQSFPELRRSLIRRAFTRLLYDDSRCEKPAWRAADKEWKYPNGSVIELGYCVAGDTPILMADMTYQQMSSIVVGDIVETLEGPRRVSAHFPVGKKDAVKISLPPGHSVVASQSHALLASSGLWLPPSALSGSSTPGRLAAATSRPSRLTARADELLLAATRRGPRLAAVAVRPSPQAGLLLGSDASTGGSRSGRTGPRSSTRGTQPPSSWTGQVALHGPAARSAALPWRMHAAHPSVRESVSNDRGAEGSTAGCSPCLDPRDAPLHGVPVDDRGRTPSPAGADTRTPPSSPEGDRTNTPARSHSEAAWYFHPYTMERRPLSVDLQDAEVSIVPVGERDLWDMTVEGANHYVSWGGMVHRNCDTDDAVGQYLSAEYDFIGFDEATEFTSYQYDMIRSRARTTVAKKRLGARPHIAGATNPGRRGHAWVKDLFVRGTDYGEHLRIVETRMPTGDVARRRIGFLPATVMDNKHIDPKYVESLMTLPENLRRQYLEGDWDSFEGQYFPEFARGKTLTDGTNVPWHVVEPFEVPHEWPRFRAIDYGYAAPFACLWFTVDQDGYVYVYREAYQTGLTPLEQAKLVTDLSVCRTRGISKPEKIDYTVADPSMWSHHGNMPLAAQYAKGGVRLRKGDNDRLAGWARVRDWLRPDQHDRPGVQVFESCSNLIRTFPELIHDKNRPEDLDTTGDDHLADALRYGLMTRPRKFKPKVDPDTSLEARIWQTIDRMSKRKRIHPELGRMT